MSGNDEPDGVAGDGHDDGLDEAIERFLGRPPDVLRGFGGLPSVERLAPGASARLEDYELVGRLGRGGMGIVWSARQRTALGRTVAVKLLPPLTSAAARERFRREAAAALALDHASIVDVLSVQTEGDRPFLAMTLVPGLSLDRILDALAERSARPRTTDPVRDIVADAAPEVAQEVRSSAGWPVRYDDWVARVCVDLADALQHAHDRGIVHRDVKPSNVMITPHGRPVLLDFGVAYQRVEEALTRTGEFVGTLHYCAPEQARGEPLDGRADVYAVGAMLYELLSLRRPHEADGPTDLLRRVLHEDPRSLGRGVPRDLRAVCRHALARATRRRYASAAALGHDLRAFRSGAPVSAPARNPLHGLWSWARRHRRLAGGIGLASFLFVGFEVRDQVRAAGSVRASAATLAQARELTAELGQRLVDDSTWLAAARAVHRVDYAELEARRGARARLRAELERAVDATRRTLERGIDHVPGHGGVRRRLADLHATRLALALRSAADVLDPARVRRIETALARFDDGRHRGLRSRRGSAELHSRPASTVRVTAADGREVYAGPTPFVAEALEEGVYAADFQRGGFAPARLLFFVRRAACDRPEGTVPPRARVVELVPEQDLEAGYVVVPGGWTLVEADPPCWEFVDTFQVAVHETTYAEYLAWLETREWRRDPSGMHFRPRFGPEPSQAHLRWDSDRRLRYVDGWSRPTWPVRGLTPMELSEFAERVDPARLDGRGWYSAVPEPGEWLRAARGVDGRRFPWGNGFDWSRCGGYPARGSATTEETPFDVGSFPGDRSPFGVMDMAGSVAELVLRPSLDRLGEFQVFGGSYRDRTRDAMGIQSRRVRNEVQPDVGVRLVRRRLPQWLREPPDEPTFCHDDFERPDGRELGHGWHAVQGALTSPSSAEGVTLCRLEAGSLVCEGETGNYAEIGSAHRFVRPGGRFVLGLRARLDSSSGWPRAGDRGRAASGDLPAGTVVVGAQRSGRGAGVTLAADLGPGGGILALKLTPDGNAVCQVGPTVACVGLWSEARGRPVELELRVEGTDVQFRAWPADGERPEEALFRAPDARFDGPPRLLSLLGPRGVGGRFEVDELELAPLD